jgi:hypothetical protein
VLARAIAQEPPELAARGYAAYQDRHADLQRQMALMIAPLRGHVRDALGRASARLRQLAALDASMEQLLAAREQALLPGLPALLKRRYQQLADEAPDDALQVFAGDWRQALLAELDLRLGPVKGLVEALANEQDK